MEELVFCGISNQKVLNLTKADQARLLTHEKFALMGWDGKTYYKECTR